MKERELEEALEYDDDDAVEFIHNYLPQELKEKYSEDTIYYVLDLICEFYDKNDYLTDEDDEKEEKELVEFILQQADKDEVGDFSREDILMILRAEDAYMETLDNQDVEIVDNDDVEIVDDDDDDDSETWDDDDDDDDDDFELDDDDDDFELEEDDD